jgi:hypothetical protein
MKYLIINILILSSIVACKTYEIDGQRFENENKYNLYLDKKRAEESRKRAISKNEEERKIIISKLIKNNNNYIDLVECMNLRVNSSSYCANESNSVDGSNRYTGNINLSKKERINENAKIKDFLIAHFNNYEFPNIENQFTISLQDLDKEFNKNIRNKKFILFETNYLEANNLSDFNDKKQSFFIDYHGNDKENLFNEKILTNEYIQLSSALVFKANSEDYIKISQTGRNNANIYLIVFGSIKEKIINGRKIIEVKPMNFYLRNEENKHELYHN